MKLLAAILALILGVPIATAAELNLAILRYRPTDKKQILAPVHLDISASKLKTEKSETILATLRKQGEAELLFQTAQNLANDKPIHIQRSDLATVVLPGETTTALPPITRLAIIFDLQYFAAQSSLTWTGSVKWSPQLVDRAAVTLTARTQTNVTIIRPFAPAGQTTGFEYPVLKETTFQSSKIARDDELIVTSTAAEAGATTPEILLLCLWLDSKTK